MKAKKIFAGAAALTLALSGAFALLPAASASAADVATKTIQLAWDDIDDNIVEYKEITFTGDGDQYAYGELSADEDLPLAFKSTGAGTAKMNVTFLKPPSADYYYGRIMNQEVDSDSMDDWSIGYFYDMGERYSTVPESIEISFEFTFDEKGELASYRLGDNTFTHYDGETDIFHLYGPLQSMSMTFTAGAAAPAETPSNDPAQPTQPAQDTSAAQPAAAETAAKDAKTEAKDAKAAKSDKKSPKTGEANTLWVLLLTAGAGAGLAACGMNERKKKQG